MFLLTVKQRYKAYIKDQAGLICHLFPVLDETDKQMSGTFGEAYERIKDNYLGAVYGC